MKRLQIKKEDEEEGEANVHERCKDTPVTEEQTLQRGRNAEQTRLTNAGMNK